MNNPLAPAVRLVVNQRWQTVEINGQNVSIPSDWTAARIGDEFEITGGGTPPTSEPSYWGGGITWVGPKYMGDNKRFVDVNRSDMKTLTQEGAKKVSEKPTPAGSLVVSSRAPVGYANLAPCDLYTNQGCYSFINIFRGDPEHLYFWVRKNRRLLETRSSGTTFLEISRKAISILEYPAPPRLEQTLIAQALAAQEALVDDWRKLAAHERQRLAWLSDELLSGRLRVEEDATTESVVVSRNEKGEPEENLLGVKLSANQEWSTGEVNGERHKTPTDWHLVSMDEAVQKDWLTLGRGNVISKKDLQAHPGKFPVYSSSSAGDGKFGEYSKHMFQEELITWSIDGGGAFFHRPVHKYSVTNVCGWMRVNDKNINPKFLFLFLQNQHKEKEFDYQSKAHPSVIRRMYYLALPSINEQTLVAQVLTAQESQVTDIERLADLEQKRLEWLSEELLSGRLRIQLDVTTRSL